MVGGQTAANRGVGHFDKPPCASSSTVPDASMEREAGLGVIFACREGGAGLRDRVSGQGPGPGAPELELRWCM